jgi:hypothetical protein
MPKRTEPGITNRSTFKSGLLAFLLVGMVLGPAAYLSACGRGPCASDAFPIGTKVRIKAFPEQQWVVTDKWCNTVNLWAPGAQPGWIDSRVLEVVP